MKTKYLLHSLLLALPGLLTGCVGYNSVLFMTKSNAGLDFDTKPPTAEINISRKEGVVAPVFEGGKTPPVLASFSSQIGSGGGVGRFFFGVDQTFAGGDSALTMAKLYDDDKKVEETPASAARFDSGLPLSKLPEANTNKGWFGWRKFFFGLPEPGEVRPFFFGTDSQLGVKVAWNGVGGAYPDTIKIGYNRKEMALAPVTLSNNVVRIPSFLATVDTSTQGSNGVGVTWMQYFATGESASFLARQYGVRQAMLERADPKAAMMSERLSMSKTATASRLQAWVKSSPDTAERKKRQDAMTAWIGGAGYTFADLLYRPDRETDRQKFLAEKAETLNIP